MARSRESELEARELKRPGRPLKILMVSPSYAPFIGGVETHVSELSNALAARGNDVVVLTQGPAEGPHAGVEHQSEHLTVVRYPLPSARVPDLPAPGLLGALARLGQEPDIVHAHSYHALPALMTSKAAIAVPRVYTLHYHGTGHSPLRRALHRLYRPLGSGLVRSAAALIAVSQAERELIGRDFGAAATRKTSVIPNGVRLRGTGPGLPKNRTVILSVGRLERYKRVDVLISALGNLSEEHELVVIGDGPAMPELMRLAQRSGVADRVRFLGKVTEEELDLWHATADVFSTASAKESFGLSLAEALHAGVPSVASAIPAHLEVVREAGSGVVVAPGIPLEPRDDAGYERELATMFADGISQALAARRAAPGASRLRGWDGIARDVEALYLRTLDGHHA